MIVGILETGEVNEALREPYGDYPAMFERFLGDADPDLSFKVIRVVSGEMPAKPQDADAWLVTGSRHGVYDPLPWIEPLRSFIKESVEAGVPVAGICFGHQILAEALGGVATKSEKGWGVGVHVYTTAMQPGWMKAVPERFSVRAFHQDQVVTPGAGATVLARSLFCEYAALAYGDPEAPDAISIQPHPEFGEEFFSDLIEARAKTVLPQEVADAAQDGLGSPVDNANWARAIVAYFGVVKERTR